MKRALLYATIAIASLYVIRELEYMGLRRVEGGEFAKLRAVFLEKNNYDILIIGSSRAECQFYPPIIDSVSGMKSYNAGMTGAVMPFIATTLESYLVHSTPPKCVVLNLDLHSLGDNTDTVYKFPRYFAYLSNKKLYEGLIERDHRFVLFRGLPLYSMPYYSNRYLSNSVRGWLKVPTKYDADYVSGFAPSITDMRLGDMDTCSLQQQQLLVPDAVWEGIEKIRSICEANDIRLILTVSPLYHRRETSVTNYATILDSFHDYATKNQLAMIDLGHDSIRHDKSMYADPAHLNKTGAMIFTRRFSAILMQYLGK